MKKASKLFYTALLGAAISLCNPTKLFAQLKEGYLLEATQNSLSYSYCDNETNSSLRAYTENPEADTTKYGVCIDSVLKNTLNKKNQVSILFKYENESFPYHAANLASGGISLDSNYNNLTNKMEAKLGNLSNDDNYGDFFIQQNLFGVKDNLGISICNRKNLKSAVGLAANLLMSQYEGKWECDNAGLGLSAKCHGNLSKKVDGRIEIMTKTYNLNKSKYFFLDEIRKSEIFSSLNWELKKGMNVNLFSLLQNEVYEKEISKNTLGAGISFKNVDARIASTDIPEEKTNQKTFNLGVNYKGNNIEVYFASLTSPENWKNIKSAGIKWSKGFGKDSKSVKEAYMPKFKDNNLSFDELVKDLDTVQEQIRWFNANMKYKEGGYPSRTAEETYANRGGDCDELSDFFTFLAAKNGIKAYELVCYTPTSGHVTPLIANKRGEIFIINNVGLPEKVDCNPNAALEEKAKSAVAQYPDYFKVFNGEDISCGLWQWKQEAGEWRCSPVFTDLPGDDSRFWYYNAELGEMKHIRETGVMALIGDSF